MKRFALSAAAFLVSLGAHATPATYIEQAATYMILENNCNIAMDKELFHRSFRLALRQSRLPMAMLGQEITDQYLLMVNNLERAGNLENFCTQMRSKF